MILYEEFFVTSLLFRGLAHIRLTRHECTCSLVLMRWVIVRIPVAAITDVHCYRSLLGHELTISYTDEIGLLKGLSFSTRQAQHWLRAFQHIGVRVSGAGP